MRKRREQEMRWRRVGEGKEKRREVTQRPAKERGEHQEAQRISEGCRECQVTKRRKREREEENTIENKRRHKRR